MDFVNRLKTFMNSESISSTQFADACRIPRPTLSQILSGRNKKISDEVIGKIHDAYPSLNIMWLLFGEGVMLVDSNIKISEPQKVGFIDFTSSQPAENVQNIIPGLQSESAEVFESEKNGMQSIFDIDDKDMGRDADFPPTQPQSVPSVESTTTMPRQVSIAADGNKSILNITVFYSDNSFQLFVPSSSTLAKQ